ncbi:MAG: hypothetical protein V4723_01460 [Pseudomonadota bacterium]
MLFFNHPKPFMQRPVAVQIAERRAEVLPDTRTIIVERKTLNPEPAAPREK